MGPEVRRRRQIGRRATIAIALLSATALLAPPLARAEFPGRNGRIAFMRQDAAGLWQTWVAGADLRAQRQLTSGPADSGWPVWSPRGTRVAFDSDRADPDLNDDTAINDIFTMRPDGSGVTKLTDSRGFSADAAWSPDGALIALDADRGDYPAQQGIYVMRADGTRLRRVTRLPSDAATDSAPRFSPDGSRLVFTRYRGADATETAALFTVGRDSRRCRQLTDFALHAGDADWSPDGRTLVFEAYPDPASRGDIYAIQANGTHLRNLTHNNPATGGSADPVWSPDGTKILFLDLHVSGTTVTNGLATMRPDGSKRAFISHDPMVEHQPDWEATR